MNIYTIGFTKKNAQQFFDLISSNDITTLIDVRLNNVSQLAGFAKRDDLQFFLKELCNVNYIHMPKMSPTKEILSNYKKGYITWGDYEKEFRQLLESREIEKVIDIDQINDSCFLCSEHKPDFCHRRLVAEYLKERLNENINIKHLF